jgi:uncharacterized protein (UPF0548 family)
MDRSRRMTGALRTGISRVGQARRVAVRAELALTALQAVFWFALATVPVGAVLLVRGRRNSSQKLAKYSDRPFTYREVGATAGELPAGYDHHRMAKVIGTGRERFDAAGDAVMHWAMQRHTGLGVTASTPQAEPGSLVVVGHGPLRAPCRVVYLIDEPDRRGFAYGTLPGHPESGEERFAVRYEPATDKVYAEVTAFSTPGTWWSRAAAPVTKLLARALMNRYLTAV